MYDDFKARKEAILQHNTIVAVAGRYNEVKKIGSDYVTICPWHDDTKPSLTIFAGKQHQRCHCFACGNGGNVIDYYMQQTGADFKEAVENLSEGILQGASNKPVSINSPVIKPAEWEIAKPPKGAMPDMEHYEFGTPADYWCFKDSAGEPLYYELRYHVTDQETGEIKKEPRPMTWGRHSKHLPYKWSFRAWPSPRPMFHLDQLHRHAASASVVLFEGPRKAKLAQSLLKVPCMSWSGGANAWTHCDLEPLRGRKVILFPDNDSTGIKAMQHLAIRLNNEYACNCEVVNVPAGKAEKWDICDEAYLTSDTLKAWLKNRDPVKQSVEHIVERPVKQSATSKKVRYIFDPAKVYNDATGSIGCESAENPIAENKPAVAETATVIPISEKYPMPSDTPNAEGWLDPENITHVPEPTYIDRSYLPTIIGNYAFATAPSLGGDPGSLAMAMLTTVASAIDDRIKVQPDRHSKWSESARIWTALIGPPSSKKSPTIGRATSHLKKLDLRQEANNSKGKMAYKALQKQYDKAMAEWADKVAQGDATAQMPEPPSKPNVVRHYANDLLIEIFGEICALNPRGMLIELDELASWIHGMSKYSAGGGSDRAGWLSAFNGGPMRVDRMSRQLAIENFSCSVLSACQPQVLKAIADSQEDGLLQRFITVFVPPAIEQVSPTFIEAQFINAAESTYNALIDWLVTMQDVKCTVIMSDEARAMHKALFRECHEIAETEAYGLSASAAFEKYEGYIARFALTYHCIECFEGGVHPSSKEVSAESMQKVCELFSRFIIPNAIYFYSEILGTVSGGGGGDIEAVCKHLLAHDYTHINAAVIRRSVMRLKKTSIQYRKELMSQLCDANWVRPDIKGRTDRITGMPMSYEVNPLIWQRYAKDRIKEQRRLAIVRKQMKEDKFGIDYQRQKRELAAIEGASIEEGAYMEQGATAHG
jgi:hypothetical protein